MGRWNRAALALMLATTLLATAAAAQQELTVVRDLRGPFQHAVVGSSLVRANGTVLAEASATLNLTSDVEVIEARLYWMGSRVTPDNSVNLTLPGGATQTVTAASGDCFLDVDVARTNVAVDDNYYACNADVTSLIAAGNPSGTYAVGDAEFETRGARYCINGTIPNGDFNASPGPCEYATDDPLALDAAGNLDVFVDNIYAGGWALLVIFRDLEDNQPRVLQVARGLVGQQNQANRDVLALQNLELAPAGGRLTHVAIGGDAFLFAGANDGERLTLCRGPCTNGQALVAQNGGAVIDSAASPTGNLYNGSISTEFSGVISAVTEANGLDLDTYDLSPAFDPNVRSNNRFVGNTTLNLGASTGIDALGHVLVVVEVADLDSDGDGLSNLEEDRDRDGIVDANETDPDNADTDGDGLCDGPVSVFGPGNVVVCLGGEDPNRDFNVGVTETYPLHPDTDGDGLCDGPNTVLAPDGATVICFGGENLDGGLLNSGEANPLDPDSDGDGLCDGFRAVPPICSGGENQNGGDVAATETNPLLPDTDADGLCDGGRAVVNALLGNCEDGEDDNENGIVDAGETDPRDPDTDGNGITDGIEVLVGLYPGATSDANPGRSGAQTNPLDVDSDGDGACDGDGSFDAAFGTCSGGEDLNRNGTLEGGETDPTDLDSAPAEGEGEGEGEGEWEWVDWEDEGDRWVLCA